MNVPNEIPTVSDLSKTVTCDDCCGACCQHMRSPPFVGVLLNKHRSGFFKDPEANGEWMDREWELLLGSPLLAKSVMLAGLFDGRPSESPCSWLSEDGRCRWWEHRPGTCRDYEVGGSDCLAERVEHGVDRVESIGTDRLSGRSDG